MSKYRNRKKGNNELPIHFNIAIFIGLLAYLKNQDFKKSITITIISIILMSAAYFFYLYIKAKKKREKYIRSGINIVDKMTGEEFEDFLLAHFQNLKYVGSTTPKTNDYGADIILKKEGEVIVVQAKRWSEKVGIEAIQQVIGAKAYYTATKCMVITNSYFTPNAVNLAQKSNVELWDRNKLLEIMSAVNGSSIASSIVDPVNVESRVLCSKCGAEMKLKNGRNGVFYGCTRYPKCKNTKSYC